MSSPPETPERWERPEFHPSPNRRRGPGEPWSPEKEQRDIARLQEIIDSLPESTPHPPSGTRLRRLPCATPLVYEPPPEPNFYPHTPTRMERLGGALGRILFAPGRLLRAMAQRLRIG